MIFVNSMSDLFHKDIPETFIRQIFEVMLRVDRHIYQVLTKRPARAARFWNRNKDLFDGSSVPRHIWMGTSVENEDVAYRVRHLLQLPTTIRFLSCEPLLGPIKLELQGIHWVIVGGESGAGFRAVNPEWIRDIRRQCKHARVPFFFKQWGGRTFNAGGRLLDDRTWDEYPLKRFYSAGNGKTASDVGMASTWRTNLDATEVKALVPRATHARKAPRITSIP